MQSLLRYSVTARGTLEDFDRTAYTAKLLSLLKPTGVSAEDITLQLTAGSVHVTATIVFGSLASALDGARRLRALSSPTQASAALGVPIDALRPPTVERRKILAPPPSPRPPTPPTTPPPTRHHHGGALAVTANGAGRATLDDPALLASIVGVIVGLLLLLLCCALAAVRYSLRRAKEAAAAAPVIPLSTASLSTQVALRAGFGGVPALRTGPSSPRATPMPPPLVDALSVSLSGSGSKNGSKDASLSRQGSRHEGPQTPTMAGLPIAGVPIPAVGVRVSEHVEPPGAAPPQHSMALELAVRLEEARDSIAGVQWALATASPRAEGGTPTPKTPKTPASVDGPPKSSQAPKLDRQAAADAAAAPRRGVRVGSHLEGIVNSLERASGQDLDGDGDIGLPGHNNVLSQGSSSSAPVVNAQGSSAMYV